MTRNDDQLPLGNIRLAAAKNSRSADRNAGRRTCRRRTASSWRSTTISSSFDAVDRTEDRPTAGHAEPRRSRGKSRHLLENNRKGPLFYADRINTPFHEARGV